MKPEEIKPGKTYRGKRFTGVPTRNNDRFVVWMDATRTQVQYDSDTVLPGRTRPIVPIEQFAKWAKRELTAEEVAAYQEGE